MSNIIKNFLNKKIEYLILSFGILLFSIPILIFGTSDVETYYWGFFSNSIYNQNFYNPFINFIDYYGPGTRVPLGFFPFYHPLSIIFSGSYKLFIFFHRHKYINSVRFYKKNFKILQY